MNLRLDLGLVFLLPILLLSMAAHEVAHGYVAFRLGDPTAKYNGRLTANPLRHLDVLGTAMFIITYVFNTGFIFGWAKPVPVNPYYFKNRQRGMMLVGLAGPVTNFLIAVLLAVIINLVKPTGGTFSEVIGLAYRVNVVLGIFNLIPIPPLDGSRVIGGFMSRNTYAKWIELDRYGMIFILLIFFVFRGPFSTLLQIAYNWIGRLLLPSYF